MMKVVSSGYHQLLRYPTPMATTDIRDQSMSRSNVVIAQKRFRWTAKNVKVTSVQDLPLEKKRRQPADQQQLQNGRGPEVDP